jgi:predicted RNase H-like HicB family nuclease
MGSAVFHVDAVWDPEAGVWVATSEDVPGLATEAVTIEALTEKLRILIPELLEANNVLPGQTGTLAFELTSHREESLTLAS